MGSASTAPPPVNNPGKDLQKYVTGLEGALPGLLGLEGQYRPEFGAMNLSDISQFLSGSGDQQGIMGLGSQANQASQAQLEAARTGEFKNMLSNTGAVNDILGAVSPGSRQLASNQTAMANDAYTRAQGPLSFQEARGADQQAREAFGSRGRINDNASVAAEILGREDVRAGKRQEAAQLGAQAFGQEQQFSQPALSLLGGSPASVLLGQDYLNRGSSIVGQNTPQLVDTGAGISLGQQANSNLASWAQNSASAQNANTAQNNQYIGQALGTAASIAMSFSDERLKTDKKKVGKTDSGLPIYTYKMKGSPKTQMGVMAQDVEKKTPSAVQMLGGLRKVDYSKVK